MCSCIFDPVIQRPRPWPEILCTYVYCTVLSVVTVLVHRIVVDAVMRGPHIVLDGRPNGPNQSPRLPTGGGGTRDAMQFLVPVAASVGRTDGRTDGRQYQKPPRIRTESESCERQTRGAEAGKEFDGRVRGAGRKGTFHLPANGAVRGCLSGLSTYSGLVRRQLTGRIWAAIMSTPFPPEALRARPNSFPATT